MQLLLILGALITVAAAAPRRFQTQGSRPRPILTSQQESWFDGLSPKCQNVVEQILPVAKEEEIENLQERLPQLLAPTPVPRTCSDGPSTSNSTSVLHTRSDRQKRSFELGTSVTGCCLKTTSVQFPTHVEVFPFTDPATIKPLYNDLGWQIFTISTCIQYGPCTDHCTCYQEYILQNALIKQPDGSPTNEWIRFPSCCKSVITNA